MEELQLDLFASNNNKENIKKEIEELRKKIEYYNIKYHEEDSPVVSDYEYDKCTQRLKKLEKENPEFVTISSPTQKVGGKTKKIFAQVSHEVQMQSLQDVFEFEDVEEFVDKVQNEYGKKTNFIVETKIDGLSVSLEYLDGKFVRGSTRGDGYIGEDVTENLKCIKDIPMELSTKETIEVRGEVYLPREEFENINKELEKQGKQLLANPRNAAAGTLRQLDTNLVKSRNLSVFVFTVLKGRKFNSDSERLDFLDTLGFKTIEKRKVCYDKESVINAIKEIGDLRDSLAYDIDGAVINVDNLQVREEMGQTVKVPKWSVAYKYPPEQKETKILDIVTQVGRTGQVTPMAILEPVKVAGSLISKTTLHNFDYIEEKDIRVGDIAIIQKAGDVIPEVISVKKEKRTGEEKEYIRPTVCPVCGEELEQEEKEVALRCTNSECPATIFRSITHFVSRGCMDISGMGDAVVEQLIDSGLLKDIADIYYLEYVDIVNLDRFAPKSALKLITAIEDTRYNSLDKLIFGLGIRYIGKKGAKILAKSYENIYKLMEASIDELAALPDFGYKMADSVYNFFKKEKTHEIIQKLEKAGVNLDGEKEELDSNKLENMTIVVTGTFEDYSRNEVVKFIEKNGGNASNSVSKKTTLVIAGENAGSKLSKAKELGIRIVDIDTFLNEYINN